MFLARTIHSEFIFLHLDIGIYWYSANFWRACFTAGVSNTWKPCVLGPLRCRWRECIRPCPAVQLTCVLSASSRSAQKYVTCFKELRNCMQMLFHINLQDHELPFLVSFQQIQHSSSHKIQRLRGEVLSGTVREACCNKGVWTLKFGIRYFKTVT